jgi:hypothetical protein
VRQIYLIGEAEEPWGCREQNAEAAVDGEMAGHGDTRPYAELIVGKKAVPDHRDAEPNGKPLGRAAVGEAEDERRGDQQCHREIVDRPVGSGRKKSHLGHPADSRALEESLRPGHRSTGPRWIEAVAGRDACGSGLVGLLYYFSPRQRTRASSMPNRPTALQEPAVMFWIYSFGGMETAPFLPRLSQIVGDRAIISQKVPTPAAKAGQPKSNHQR